MEDFAQDLGMARGTLYLYFNKARLDLDFLHLLKEKGYDFDPGPDVTNVNEPERDYKPERGNIMYVPLVAYGGFLQGYANEVFIKSLERFSIPGLHGELYAFEVQGSSFLPIAKPRDIVVTQREEKLEWMLKGRGYVLQTIDGLIVKLFEKITDGKAHFKSVNKDGDSPTVALKELKGVYLIVGVFNKGIVSVN